MQATPEEYPRCLKRQTNGNDLSRCEGHDVDGVLKLAEEQTPSRTEAGLTQSDRTVLEGPDCGQQHQRWVRGTKFLDRPSGKVTAKGNFSEVISTRQALDTTAISTTKPKFKNRTQRNFLGGLMVEGSITSGAGSRSERRTVLTASEAWAGPLKLPTRTERAR